MRRWAEMKRIRERERGSENGYRWRWFIEISLNCLQLEVWKRLGSWESCRSWKSHSNIETRCRKSAAQTLGKLPNYGSRPNQTKIYAFSIAFALFPTNFSNARWHFHFSGKWCEKFSKFTPAFPQNGFTIKLKPSFPTKLINNNEQT